MRQRFRMISLQTFAPHVRLPFLADPPQQKHLRVSEPDMA